MQNYHLLTTIGIQIILYGLLNFNSSAQSQNLNNGNLENVNAVWINDPGPEEGIKWLGTAANWNIDVSPENRSNADGNLNLYGTSGKIALWRPLLLKSELQVVGSGNHYISNGNLGLGTINASSKLSIRNVGATDGVKLLDFSESDGESFLFKGNFLGTGASGNSLIIGSNVSGYQSNIMTWRGDGNVGVGIVNPNSRMHIYKDATGSQTLLTLEKHEGDINENSEINFDFVFTDTNTNGTPQARISSEANTDNSNGGGMEAEGTADLKFWTANSLNSTTNELVERMRISSLGNVGIGTSSTGSHKLAVEGSIGAREIKVEAGTGWSDFVFYDNYELPTLVEVENHIKEKGHLKDIPSEAEVTENGINLGEMNAKLLQKVEELTLYLIEQNKQIQTQQADIATLKTKVLQLEKE